MSSAAASSTPKRVLSLDSMSFEEHMLYSTLRFHASGKMGVSLAQLHSLCKQKPKYGSQVSHFSPDYKTERELQAALKIFVTAGWAICAVRDRQDKYFVTDKEVTKAMLTGTTDSLSDDEIDQRVFDGLVYLSRKTANFEIYHEFCTVCWAGSVAGGSAATSLNRLLGKPMKIISNAENGTDTYACVIKMSLPKNSNVFWGLKHCDAPVVTVTETTQKEEDQSASNDDSWGGQAASNM